MGKDGSLVSEGGRGGSPGDPPEYSKVASSIVSVGQGHDGGEVVTKTGGATRREERERNRRAEREKQEGGGGGGGGGGNGMPGSFGGGEGEGGSDGW